MGYPKHLKFDLFLCKPFDHHSLACFLCHQLTNVQRTHDNCWRLSQPTSDHVVPLPEHELQTFKTLLDMGRLVRIADWARTLANPYKEMASHVVQLAETADVPALNQLLGVWTRMANPVSVDGKADIVTIQE